VNIEKYLVLTKYVLSLFGLSDFKDLQEKLKDVPVVVDSDGRTYFINILRSYFEGLRKGILLESGVHSITDSVLAGAIVDRVVHYSTIIMIKGPSYRSRNLKKGVDKKLAF